MIVSIKTWVPDGDICFANQKKCQHHVTLKLGPDKGNLRFVPWCSGFDMPIVDAQKCSSCKKECRKEERKREREMRKIEAMASSGVNNV